MTEKLQRSFQGKQRHFWGSSKKKIKKKQSTTLKASKKLRMSTPLWKMAGAIIPVESLKTTIKRKDNRWLEDKTSTGVKVTAIISSSSSSWSSLVIIFSHFSAWNRNQTGIEGSKNQKKKNYLNQIEREFLRGIHSRKVYIVFLVIIYVILWIEFIWIQISTNNSVLWIQISVPKQLMINNALKEFFSCKKDQSPESRGALHRKHSILLAKLCSLQPDLTTYKQKC